MSDEIIVKSALFFFLLTLDEKATQEATEKALYKFKLRAPAISENTAPTSSHWETALDCWLEEWQFVRKNFRRTQSQVIMSKSLRWPENLDLGPWKEFQKRAPENELIAVLCIHVIGLPEEMLARSLKISEGSVRYRVGRGLTLLGQLNRPNISSIQYS